MSAAQATRAQDPTTAVNELSIERVVLKRKR